MSNKIKVDDIAYIIQLYNDKIPLKEIGLKFGVTAQSIAFHLKKAGIFRVGNFALSEKDKFEIIRLYNEGLTCAEIATRYKVNDFTISGRLRSWGVKCEPWKRKRVSKQLGISEKEIIEKYIELNKDANETGKYFGISRPTVIAIARRNKINTSKEDFNEFMESKRTYVENQYKLNIGAVTIAKEIGIGFSTLYLAMRGWGMQISYPRVAEIESWLEIDKSLIKDDYYVKNLSYKEIVKKYGISCSRLGLQFKKWGWEARDARYKESSLERKFKKILDELKIGYRQFFDLAGRVYDFYLPDYHLLVEMNGDYWHSNPKVYPDATKLQPQQKFGIERDVLKFGMAKALNYKIIFIWELEMNTKIDQILKILLKFPEIPEQSSPTDFLTDRI